VIPDTTLVIVWLVFAHLVADFVLQNDWIALNKGSGTSEGNKALLTHGVHVGLCLVPAVLAFGLPGLAYLVLVVVSHMLVDRWKVQATRRAEDAAQAAALARMERTGEVPTSGLGGAWTPWPGMLFLADQALHMTFAIVGWLVILYGVPLTAVWVDVVNLIFRDWNRATVNAVILTGVVLVSLFLVNTRGAYYFVLALVSPRDLRRTGVQPAVEPPADGAPAPESRPATPAVPVGAPARIGATIGALERILIVTFVLVGATAAVGVVIAVKTLARFKQLDDRGFAEYYLLGTLASVSVAIGSAYLALAAFSSLS
jgi:hypothetical protein